jgi:prepilin-type N-terminal cleavage/methylation domain-containing protein
MKRNGFTLIELSIVLIIIGLIISGVMKGRDLINSAEQKKVYTTWLKQWAVVINEYEDRTGHVLADGTANGGRAATEDGRMDNVNLGTTTSVQNALKAVGLEVPTVGTNNGGSHILKGKYYSRTVNIQLLNNGNTDGNNAIYIGAMPTDLAVAFDKMTDGTTDPINGDFGNYSDRTTTTWPDASSTNSVNIFLKTN